MRYYIFSGNVSQSATALLQNNKKQGLFPISVVVFKGHNEPQKCFQSAHAAVRLFRH